MSTPSFTLTISKGPGPPCGAANRRPHGGRGQCRARVTRVQGEWDHRVGTKTVLTTDPPAGESRPFGSSVQIIMRST